MKRSVMIGAIALLWGIAPSCASGGLGESLQRSLSADPRLAENAAQEGTTAEVSTGECDDAVLAQLPDDFPAPLCYPNAELLDSDDGDTASSSSATQSSSATVNGAIATRWQTSDSLDPVEQFYVNLLTGADWDIVLQTDGDERRELEGVKQGERVRVQMQANASQSDSSNSQQGENQASENASDENEQDEQDANSPRASSTAPGTTFTVEFRPVGGAIAEAPALTPEDSRLFSQIDPDHTPSQDESESDTSADPSESSPSRQRSTATFTDIDQAPDELQGYIEDLAKLGILTAPNGDAENQSQSSGEEFKPNAPITRREYAEWLFAANNVFYGDRPSRKIRSASPSESPAFQDISQSADGFEAIQSLANAGLIPSSLAGDASAANFRPDAPLTREALIAWKVPLDRRGNLPNATVADVEQTWGFQDAASITPSALRAVLADYQNGDNANILRAFGYTTLFQPQKSVTRAEAAAVLWSFGYQGDGISAESLIN